PADHKTIVESTQPKFNTLLISPYIIKKTSKSKLLLSHSIVSLCPFPLYLRIDIFSVWTHQEAEEITYAFSHLNGVTPWNISPPDVCHDLAEGVIPRLLSIILQHGIKLNANEVIEKINSFKFNNGSLRGKVVFKQTTNGPEILVYGKAIQKVELFSKIQEIFLSDVDIGSEAFKLYQILHDITRISFSYKVTNEDLVCLATRSKELVEVYSKFSIDNEVLSDDELDYCHHEDIHQNDDDDLIDGSLNPETASLPSRKVFPKLHFLLHYPEAIKKFGPLMFYCVLKYERKNIVFKALSQIMCNHLNPAYTFISRHQECLAKASSVEDDVSSDSLQLSMRMNSHCFYYKMELVNQQL
ncbi:hypothetical protein BLOT_015686, partial [Blomia tropicalis]